MGKMHTVFFLFDRNDITQKLGSDYDKRAQRGRSNRKTTQKGGENMKKLFLESGSMTMAAAASVVLAFHASDLPVY